MLASSKLFQSRGGESLSEILGVMFEELEICALSKRTCKCTLHISEEEKLYVGGDRDAQCHRTYMINMCSKIYSLYLEVHDKLRYGISHLRLNLACLLTSVVDPGGSTGGQCPSPSFSFEPPVQLS